MRLRLAHHVGFWLCQVCLLLLCPYVDSQLHDRDEPSSTPSAQKKSEEENVIEVSKRNNSASNREILAKKEIISERETPLILSARFPLRNVSQTGPLHKRQEASTQQVPDPTPLIETVNFRRILDALSRGLNPARSVRPGIRKGHTSSSSSSNSMYSSRKRNNEGSQEVVLASRNISSHTSDIPQLFGLGFATQPPKLEQFQWLRRVAAPVDAGMEGDAGAPLGTAGQQGETKEKGTTRDHLVVLGVGSFTGGVVVIALVLGVLYLRRRRLKAVGDVDGEGCLTGVEADMDCPKSSLVASEILQPPADAAGLFADVSTSASAAVASAGVVRSDERRGHGGSRLVPQEDRGRTSPAVSRVIAEISRSDRHTVAASSPLPKWHGRPGDTPLCDTPTLGVPSHPTLFHRDGLKPTETVLSANTAAQRGREGSILPCCCGLVTMDRGGRLQLPECDVSVIVLAGSLPAPLEQRQGGLLLNVSFARPELLFCDGEKKRVEQVCSSLECFAPGLGGARLLKPALVRIPTRRSRFSTGGQARGTNSEDNQEFDGKLLVRYRESRLAPGPLVQEEGAGGGNGCWLPAEEKLPPSAASVKRTTTAHRVPPVCFTYDETYVYIYTYHLSSIVFQCLTRPTASKGGADKNQCQQQYVPNANQPNSAERTLRACCASGRLKWPARLSVVTFASWPPDLLAGSQGGPVVTYSVWVVICSEQHSTGSRKFVRETEQGWPGVQCSEYVPVSLQGSNDLDVTLSSADDPDWPFELASAARTQTIPLKSCLNQSDGSPPCVQFQCRGRRTLALHTVSFQDGGDDYSSHTSPPDPAQEIGDRWTRTFFQISQQAENTRDVKKTLVTACHRELHS